MGIMFDNLQDVTNVTDGLQVDSDSSSPTSPIQVEDAIISAGHKWNPVITTNWTVIFHKPTSQIKHKKSDVYRILSQKIEAEYHFWWMPIR